MSQLWLQICFGSIAIPGVLYLLLQLFFGALADVFGDVADTIEGPLEGAIQGLDEVLEGVGIDIIPDDIDLFPDVVSKDGQKKPFGCGTILTFMAGFGTTGLIISSLGAGVLLTLFLSVLIGILVAAAYFGIMYFMFKQEFSSTTAPSEIVGQIGRVTINTPAGEVGQAMFKVGQTKAYPVVEVNQEPLARNDQVKVLRVESGRLYVEKVKS